MLCTRMSSLPCTSHDSHAGSPLDGPHENRCVGGAGRPRRATGSCAKGSRPERQSVSVPQDLPARRDLPQAEGGCA